MIHPQRVNWAFDVVLGSEVEQVSRTLISIAEVVAQSIEDLEKIDEAVDTASLTGWDIAAALSVLVLTWPVAVAAGRVAGRLSRRVPGLPDYVHELAMRGARVVVGIIGLSLAMSLLGVDVGWFSVSLGLVGIIAVLMLRPLIENLAAGLLLQTRPSFSIGDEIETNGIRGEVISINARSTVVKTRDWKSVHIPNQDVLSDSITVFTAFERRRSAIELEVEYSADIDRASQLVIEAASAVDGVASDPPPYVRVRGFGTGTTVLSLRWWHDPDLSSDSRTLDGVVRQVKRVLDDAGIELPSPEFIVRQPDQASG